MLRRFPAADSTDGYDASALKPPGLGRMFPNGNKTPSSTPPIRMKIDLLGKTAIVTGSTAGIGYAIAQGLAQAGADVVVNGRSATAVERAVAKLTSDVAQANIRGVAADVGTAGGCAPICQAWCNVIGAVCCSCPRSRR